jgi:hypothetical protein
MVSQPKTAVMTTTRDSRVRRHCSTICIALVVARFTPAITLAGPASPDPVPEAVSTMPAATTVYLVARVCPLPEQCGTITATISTAPRDAEQ